MALNDTLEDKEPKPPSKKEEPSLKTTPLIRRKVQTKKREINEDQIGRNIGLLTSFP